jgi:hypothetical protein
LWQAGLGLALILDMIFLAAQERIWSLSSGYAAS